MREKEIGGEVRNGQKRCGERDRERQKERERDIKGKVHGR